AHCCASHLAAAAMGSPGAPSHGNRGTRRWVAGSGAIMPRCARFMVRNANATPAAPSLAMSPLTSWSHGARRTAWRCRIDGLLVLLSQTESPRRRLVGRDSAHGRGSRQDRELSWKTRGAAVVARHALRPILPIWPACWGMLGGLRQ